MPYCSECGSRADDLAAFCSSCGARLPARALTESVPDAASTTTGEFVTQGSPLSGRSFPKASLIVFAGALLLFVASFLHTQRFGGQKGGGLRFDQPGWWWSVLFRWGVVIGLAILGMLFTRPSASRVAAGAGLGISLYLVFYNVVWMLGLFFPGISNRRLELSPAEGLYVGLFAAIVVAIGCILAVGAIDRVQTEVPVPVEPSDHQVNTPEVPS